MSARFALRGVGILGPGRAGWHAARDVLAGAAPWRDEAVATPELQGLPVTERRRVNALSRWSIAVAEEAASSLDGDARASLCAVFASADGDGEVLLQSLGALASADPRLSPTLFHNSVFNAPAGYWSIATRSTGWATMLCGGEGSVAAALLEGASQALVSAGAVLCVVADLGFPDRLADLYPSRRPFACALVLDAGGARDDALGSIEIGADFEEPGSDAASDGHDAIGRAFGGNASAAALPLFARIARRDPGPVRLPVDDGRALLVRYLA